MFYSVSTLHVVYVVYMSQLFLTNELLLFQYYWIFSPMVSAISQSRSASTMNILTVAYGCMDEMLRGAWVVGFYLYLYFSTYLIQSWAD